MQYGGPLSRRLDESNESEACQALMFVLTMLYFQKSLASLSIRSLVSALPTRFEFLNATANRVESSTAEKVFLFSSSFLVHLWGETKVWDRGKEFTIAEGTVKVRLESILENVSVIAFSSKLLSIWLNAFTGFRDKAVEVHLLGYCTVVFASCDSVQVDANANKYFFLWDRDIIREELFLTWGGYWPWKLCWNTTRHHISSSFKQFFWDLQSWNLNKL